MFALRNCIWWFLLSVQRKVTDRRTPLWVCWWNYSNSDAKFQRYQDTQVCFLEDFCTHISAKYVSVLVSKNALQICIKWAMCYCFRWILLAEPHYTPFTVVHIMAKPKFSHFLTIGRILYPFENLKFDLQRINYLKFCHVHLRNTNRQLFWVLVCQMSFDSFSSSSLVCFYVCYIEGITFSETKEPLITLTLTRILLSAIVEPALLC